MRESLELAGAGYEQEERRGLIAWMCVLCTGVSTGEARRWFVRKLRCLGFGFVESEETAMFRLLNLRVALGNGCIEKIQKEVEIMPRR